MKCLAVNTATSVLSVALIDGDEVLYYFETPETRDQGNLLLKHAGAGLEKAGMAYTDLDLLAVVTGPGSFTGIRIGIAAMRGIALAANVPCAGVSSFDMFAVPGGNNLVAVESWREELYFRLDGTEPVNVTPDVFAGRVTGPVTVSGDAAEKIMPFLKNAKIFEAKQNALHAGLFAISNWKSKENGLKDMLAVPFYLREADISLPNVSAPK
jgi:tRNA threonylcarbamoyladenosine biosynthesis protein TsaB